jgi:hypothetical protein
MTEPAASMLESRIRINDNVLFQELQGEGVLLNLDTGVYFGLDEMGARIWQLFETHKVLSEIVKALLAEYDVTEQRCAEDLLTLVAEMEKQKLISLDPQQNRP